MAFIGLRFKCTREGCSGCRRSDLYRLNQIPQHFCCILEKMTSAEFKRWLEKHGSPFKYEKRSSSGAAGSLSIRGSYAQVRTKSWAEGWLNGSKLNSV